MNATKIFAIFSLLLLALLAGTWPGLHVCHAGIFEVSGSSQCLVSTSDLAQARRRPRRHCEALASCPCPPSRSLWLPPGTLPCPSAVSWPMVATAPPPMATTAPASMLPPRSKHMAMKQHPDFLAAGGQGSVLRRRLATTLRKCARRLARQRAIKWRLAPC